MKTTDINLGVDIGFWHVISGPYKEIRQSANSVNHVTLYECRCQCGTTRRVRVAKLVRNSRSCGCAKIAAFTAMVLKHGQSRGKNRTRLYSMWSGMIQRCTNVKNSNFHLYGGVGITVCPEWRDFATFSVWASVNGYIQGLEIDRIDSSHGYCPSNCRWVTTAAQQRNKRTVWKLTAFGETKCLTDWALDSRCSVTPSTIRERLKKPGYTPERAITAPRKTRFQSARFAGNHQPAAS